MITLSTSISYLPTKAHPTFPLRSNSTSSDADKGGSALWGIGEVRLGDTMAE